MADLTSGAKSRGEGTWRRHQVGQVGVLVVTLCLIVLTWLGTYSAMEAERRAARAQVQANAFDQAFAIGEKFSVQMLGYEQSIRVLEREWERDPARFEFQEWQHTLFPVPDPTVGLFLTDESGTIKASTSAELVGVRLDDREFFKREAALARDDGALSVDHGPRGVVADTWSITISRRLDDSAGKFSGIVGATFHSASLGGYFLRANTTPGAVMLLVEHSGYLRAVSGGVEARPGQNIARSDLFRATVSGVQSWIGPTPLDGVIRFHGFYTVPGRDVTVIVGYDRLSALRSSDAWQRGAAVFALGITVFLVLIATLLIRDLRAVRERERRMGLSRAELERAYGELKATKAQADIKTGQLEATFAGMSDGVSLLDRGLRLVQWNDRFCELAGVRSSDLYVGMPFAALLRLQAAGGEFGPVDPDAEVSRRLTVLAEQRQPYVVERKRPNGATLELRRTPLPSGGYVTLYSDISARKAAEETQQRARAAAEEAAEEKSRFAAIVSHEIRTPLNTLLNSLGLLSQPGLLPESRRVVLLAQQAGEALHDLLSDILEMAKLEAGRLQLRSSRFEVRPLLAGVLDLFRPQSGDGRTVFRLDLAPEVPVRIEGDPVRLRQILMNLLSNAIKFSDPGEVVLQAAVAQGSLMLRVLDPGPTIAEADRARLFEAFSRLERSDGASKPGSGLGLTICRKLTALLGGEIGCDAAPGGGNAFWIRLPLSAAEGPGEDRASATQLILPRTRVLLVDDLAANRTITSVLLERFGHLVEVAASGPEAVALAARLPFDIAFLDVWMPGTDGMETARRLRALGGPASRLPLVALTANVDEATRIRCIAAGMQDVLPKPVDAVALQQAIGQWVWNPSAGNRPAGQPQGSRRPKVPAISPQRLAELRGTISDPALAGLLDACLGDLHVKVMDCEQALNAEDCEAAAGALHALFGVAGSYGFAAFEQQVRAADAALASAGPPGAAVLLPELKRTLAELSTAVAGLFETEHAD